MGHSRTPTYSAAGDGFPAEPIVGSGIDGKLSLLVKSFLNQLARRWAAPSAGAVGAAHLHGYPGTTEKMPLHASSDATLMILPSIAMLS